MEYNLFEYLRAEDDYRAGSVSVHGGRVHDVVSTGEERHAKAFALDCIANLVEDGLALLVHTADGASELRLVTGEVYRLGEKTLRRIA
jgi:hypothetical protein